MEWLKKIFICSVARFNSGGWNRSNESTKSTCVDCLQPT